MPTIFYHLKQQILITGKEIERELQIVHTPELLKENRLVLSSNRLPTTFSDGSEAVFCVQPDIDVTRINKEKERKLLTNHVTLNYAEQDFLGKVCTERLDVLLPEFFSR